jgi:hypothetical protein
MRFTDGLKIYGLHSQAAFGDYDQKKPATPAKHQGVDDVQSLEARIGEKQGRVQQRRSASSRKNPEEKGPQSRGNLEPYTIR